VLCPDSKQRLFRSTLSFDISARIDIYRVTCNRVHQRVSRVLRNLSNSRCVDATRLLTLQEDRSLFQIVPIDLANVATRGLFPLKSAEPWPRRFSRNSGFAYSLFTR